MAGATPGPGRSGDRSPTDRPILAFDTATTVAVIALGEPDGRVVTESTWTAGYRHGEELLVRIDEVLAHGRVALSDLGGIVVGTGPGAFTGLRVGLATAKGLAHGLAVPLVGVPTRKALQAAVSRALVTAGPADDTSAGPVALLLPAGPSDRLLVEPDGPTMLIPGGTEPVIDAAWTVAALDLDGRAPAAALALGARARSGLAAALLSLGAVELAAGRPSDLATLVPEYVTLPRGVRGEVGTVAWSRDPR